MNGTISFADLSHCLPFTVSQRITLFSILPVLDSEVVDTDKKKHGGGIQQRSSAGTEQGRLRSYETLTTKQPAHNSF